MNYGWKPDTFDARDHRFTAARGVGMLPRSMDLTTALPNYPAPYDQGQLGSCTGNGVAFIHQFKQLVQGKRRPFMPSRLFIYFNERALEGTINEDAGAMVRDGLKVIANTGACSERMWPYVPSRFATQPPRRAFWSASFHQALSYARVDQSLDALRSALAAMEPVVFGFQVFESFESQAVATSGIMPMPRAGERLLGGHCVVLVGYDDATRRFKVRNSWGTDWGQGGHFYMPYEFVTDPNMASDFWQLSLVE